MQSFDPSQTDGFNQTLDSTVSADGVSSREEIFWRLEMAEVISLYSEFSSFVPVRPWLHL